jgi:hypothetical protein
MKILIFRYEQTFLPLPRRKCHRQLEFIYLEVKTMIVNVLRKLMEQNGALNKEEEALLQYIYLLNAGHYYEKQNNEKDESHLNEFDLLLKELRKIGLYEQTLLHTENKTEKEMFLQLLTHCMDAAQQLIQRIRHD